MMNKKFFKDNITVYHKNNDKVSIYYFNEVYFRHNKKINQIDKGVQMASTGTIYIPTVEEINIKTDDLIIKGIIKDEYNFLTLMKKYKVFKVVSVDDNRKGGLQHFKVGVTD